MKAAFIAVLAGAILVLAHASCPTVNEYKCVKDKPKRCAAKEVCEDPPKEKCGDKECEYPYTCASLKKEECKKFVAIKKKCEEEKKVCKAILKPCGDDFCKLTQDCVKEEVCKIVPVYGYLHKRGGNAVAVANAVASGGGNAHAVATAHAGGSGCAYCHIGEKEVCKDVFTCVDKEPCKDVIVKKCVESYLRPGIDVCHGGKDFYWYYIQAHEKCGDVYCKPTEKCAEVIVKKCKTECGHDECDYGYECVPEKPECEEFPYLAEVCRDVYEPVCVPLSPYARYTYEPECKTVYACDDAKVECGDSYCQSGYKCEVTEKEVCARPAASASATVTATAANGESKVEAGATGEGGGNALATGTAMTEESAATGTAKVMTDGY